MTATLDTTAPDASASPRLREDLLTPDPLLDCLVEVCRLHGLPASRASLSAGLPLDKGALPLNLAERAAGRAGLATKVQRLALARIDALTLPAILILKGEQACVLLGLETASTGSSAGAAKWRILLPDSGQGAITLSTE